MDIHNDVVMLSARSLLSVLSLATVFYAWRILRLLLSVVFRGLTLFMRRNRLAFLLGEVILCIPTTCVAMYHIHTYIDALMDIDAVLVRVGASITLDQVSTYQLFSVTPTILMAFHVCAEAPDARVWSKTIQYYIVVHAMCFATVLYLSPGYDFITGTMQDVEVYITLITFTYILSTGSVVRSGLVEYKTYIPFRRSRVIVMACLSMLVMPVWRPFLWPEGCWERYTSVQFISFVCVVLGSFPLWKAVHIRVWGRWPTVAGMVPTPTLTDIQNMLRTIDVESIISAGGVLMGFERKREVVFDASTEEYSSNDEVGTSEDVCEVGGDWEGVEGNGGYRTCTPPPLGTASKDETYRYGIYSIWKSLMDKNDSQ